ncbi:MAG: DUF3048 domain-containing protein [Candidatus Woesebacteria bacterium]
MQAKHIGLLVATYIAVSALSFGGFRLALGTSGGSSVLNGLTGGSFENLISPAVPKSQGGTGVDQSLPKTEECPINGEKFTAPERQAWEKKRPLFVMIENHPDARPQSGLGSADIVYEAVVEGGITRFMAGFYCAAQAKDVIVAPVRSARQMFIDYASEYDFPLYAHVGGANNYGNDGTDSRVRALEHLSDYKWSVNNDIDGMGVSFPVFARNYNRVPSRPDPATEHTMESSTERLWTFAASKRSLTNVDSKGVDWSKGFVKWAFADDAAESARGSVKTVSYEFWSGLSAFAVKWDYDSTTNAYFRNMAGEKHIDMNDQKQLVAKNVVILFEKEESSVDVHKHVYYTTIGTGKALVFQNGQQIEATWSKKDRLGRLSLVDKKGQAIKFVRGKIWISVLPLNNTVTAQ